MLILVQAIKVMLWVGPNLCILTHLHAEDLMLRTAVPVLDVGTHLCAYELMLLAGAYPLYIDRPARGQNHEVG